MDDSNPPALARIAVPVLILALAGAVAYVVHLRSQVAEHSHKEAARPAAAAPAAAPVAPAAPAAPAADAVPADIVTAAQAEAILNVLKGDGGTGRTVWFHIQQGKAESGAVEAALARVFTQAGWTVQLVQSPYPLKPGIFLMAGDETPPDFVTTVNDALEAAGWDVKYLTGYREYFTSKKAQDPNWHGPELAADQPFVVVIGGRPPLKTSSTE